MPQRIELEEERDFSGGWNLSVAPYDLATNESPSLQNVDIQRRGGFSIRRGTKAFITTPVPVAASTRVDFVYTYTTSTSTRQILAGNNRAIWRWDGSAWQVVVGAFGGIGAQTRFAEMNNILYVFHYQKPQVGRWDGTTWSLLANPGYNDNIAAPNDGNAPPAATGCVHNSVMFLGNVFEAPEGVHKLSRIRWSHPGRPEDYRTNDFIDLDPEDESGEVRALVSFGDRLIVFKDHSVYAVHGYPPEGFTVTTLTKEVGTPSQEAVAVSEGRIFFWDTRVGLCEYDGREVKWHFERLFPLIDNKQIDLTFSHQVKAIWHNRRVWLSVPYLAAPYANQRVGLVFDPDVGKNGAWTIHDRTLNSFHIHRPADGGNLHLIGGQWVPGEAASGELWEIDVENFYEDQQIPPSDPTLKIDAFYQTRWFDGKTSAVTKRWKRPVLVVGADANQEFQVDVFNDYDPTHVRKTFSVFTDLNGTEGVWDISDWDEVVWAAEGGDKAVVLKGSTLGTGISKAFRFRNLVKGVDWRIHGLTAKWINKRVRS